MFIHLCFVYSVLLLFVECSVGLQCDQGVINNVGDFIITQLITKYEDTVKLKNITGKFLFGTGTIEASYGYLASLYSLTRVGDLIVTVNNDTVHVAMKIKFNYLIVNYDVYKVKVIGLNTEGTLQATIKNNEIEIQVTMSKESFCFVTIDAVKFTKFDSIDVELKTTCKVCTDLTSSVTTSVVNFFKDKIKSLAQAKLDQTLRKVLKPNNKVICRSP